MVNKNYCWFISLFLLSLSILFASPLARNQFFIDNKIRQLYIILVTVVIQIPFILTIRSRYKYKAATLYLLHPIFYINAVVILYFFAPFIFFLFNNDLFYQPWCETHLFSYTDKPLIIFCMSVIFFNLVCYFLDGKLLKENKHLSITNIASNIKQSELQIWIIIYIVIWVMRLLSIYTGTYWHTFLTESTIAKRVAYSRVISSMNFFTTVICPVVWFVFSVLYFTKYKSDKRYRILFWLLILSEMVYYFPSGGKFMIINSLIAYFFAGFVLRRNIKKQFFAFLILFILLLPIHNRFRLGEKFNMETARYIHKSTEKGYLFAVLDALFKRAEVFPAYFAFVEQCKDFLYGKSYIQMFVAPIPRPIWPGKPKHLETNQIGRQYGLIDKHDFITSPGIGIWAEAFLNFGYTGLFLISIFCSLVFLTVFKHMLKDKYIFGLALCAYCPLWFFMFVHFLLSGVVGSIIQIFMVFTILKMIMKTATRNK